MDLTKRKLNKSEIDDIISSISIIHNIPDDTRDSIIMNVRKNVSKQLETIEIYPKMIPVLKKNINYQYNKSKISPGESVGVLTAQSIGERQTQMTLDTFHSAGVAIKTVITGVPRFSELLNATKEPKSRVCNVYFNKGNDTISELRDTIGNSIVQYNFEDLYKSYTINTENLEKPWYKSFEILYSNQFKNYSNNISFKIDIQKIHEYSIDIKLIAEKIEQEYDDIYCVFSPNYIGELDIFINTSQVEIPDDNEYIRKNYLNIYIDEVIINNINSLLICGIKNIEDIFYKRDDSKWMIETYGSNFQSLMSHPDVDKYRLISNDMWEIYNNLGIEAAREFLIEEFKNVISSDGTYINKRHILLLVDMMTFTGSILSISRYGMKKEHTGPLAKASFEESLDNFLKAGIFNDTENTDGVSASIICAKRSKIGTGMNEVLMDLDQLSAEIM